jgi:hypothetical protein
VAYFWPFFTMKMGFLAFFYYKNGVFYYENGCFYYENGCFYCENGYFLRLFKVG